MSADELARYDRIVFARETRRRAVLRQVIVNHAERTANSGVYNVADRATGQSHAALMRGRA